MDPSTKNITVILLDAFRSDYIQRERTPFLHSLRESSNYTNSIGHTPGFCERAELMTGVNSHEMGFLTAIRYQPSESPYYPLRHFEFLLKPISSLMPYKFKRYMRAILRRLVPIYFRKDAFPISNIPISDLHYFALSEDKNSHYSPNAFSPFRGISDKIDVSKTRLDFSQFTTLRNEKQSNLNDNERLIEHIKLYNQHNLINSDKQLISFIYISNADVNGHKLGPDKYSKSKDISLLDNILNEHYLSTKDKRHIIFYIGDHGMEEINKSMDVISIFQRLPSDIERQIKCFFVDSTLCRIWLKKEASKHEVIKALNDFNDDFSNLGEFLDVNSLPGSLNKENGDILWAANPEVIIWPDYFHMPHLSMPKGMHGYISTKSKQSVSKGIVIASQNYENLDKSLPIDLVDVGSKISSLLET